MTLSAGVQARTDGVPDAPVSSAAAAVGAPATSATTTSAATHLSGLRRFFAGAAVTTGAVAPRRPRPHRAGRRWASGPRAGRHPVPRVPAGGGATYAAVGATSAPGAGGAARGRLAGAAGARPAVGGSAVA